jgi:glycosyltransferase involved in cell wall biosynthesis
MSIAVQSVKDEELPAPYAGRTGWPWDQPARRLPITMPNGQPWPKITIVTPAYNQAQFLEETVRSVLLQGYPNVEYIIVNDGSTDNTVEVIQHYENCLDYWITQQNGGQASAINHGMERASGDILGWLNSDDLLLPRALERAALARMRDPEAKVTCGFRKVIDIESRVVEDWVHPLPENHDLMRSCFVAQETVFWNREVWEHIGPLESKWRVVLDYEFWHRMIAHGYRFTLLPYFMGAFRLYPQCKTMALADVCLREHEELFRRYLGRDLSVGDAWNETDLGYQVRMIRALPPTVFHMPYLVGPILKGIAWVGSLAKRRRSA